MPLTPWSEIAGERCVVCGKYASHYWGVEPYCCQCHGGNLFPEEETEEHVLNVLHKMQVEPEGE